MYNKIGELIQNSLNFDEEWKKFEGKIKETERKDLINEFNNLFCGFSDDSERVVEDHCLTSKSLKLTLREEISFKMDFKFFTFGSILSKVLKPPHLIIEFKKTKDVIREDDESKFCQGNRLETQV